MSHHLAIGCRKCAELHDSLRAVYEVAETDDRFEPPAGTLRVAKAIFNRPRTLGPLAQMLETVTLLFDSQLSPAAAGMRNGLAGPRKLVFAWGDRIIDLQVGPSHQHNGYVVIGQISAPRQTDRQFAGLEVGIHKRGRALAKATTNQFGEFQIEFEGPADALFLVFGPDPAATAISLNTLTKVQS